MELGGEDLAPGSYCYTAEDEAQQAPADVAGVTLAPEKGRKKSDFSELSH
jgi:hypothetical protein